MSFDISDRAKVTIETRDESDNLADPTKLVLSIKPPGAALVTHEWPGDVTKEAVGKFWFLIDLDAAGVWRWRWDATGSVQLRMPDGQLTVRASNLEGSGMSAPSAQEIRAWSKVEFGELGYPDPEGGDDTLDIQIERSVAEFQKDTGMKLANIELGSDDAILAGEAIQMYTEWRVGSSQPEILESAYDFDMIQSFSAGSYSETRRGIGAGGANVLHPWPRLNRLLLLLTGGFDGGNEVPVVGGEGLNGERVDWERQRYIIDACGRRGIPIFPGFVYSTPWDTGVPLIP